VFPPPPKELAKAVAGVVLAQTPESIPDAAIGQNDLQAKHHFTCVAVANRVVAARVSLRSRRRPGPFPPNPWKRQRAILGGCRLLCGLERHARIECHGEIDNVKLPDLFMRVSESTIWLPSALGVAPPIMPVLPPWGTIAIRLSAQNRTTDATSAAEAGRTTACVCPW